MVYCHILFCLFFFGFFNTKSQISDIALRLLINQRCLGMSLKPGFKNVG